MIAIWYLLKNKEKMTFEYCVSERERERRRPGDGKVT
jgi:hypothetical protein